MSHKLTIFLDKDGVINEGLYWAKHTKELLELLTYNDDIQVYWATTWFWRKKSSEFYKEWGCRSKPCDLFYNIKSYQEFYYKYYIIGNKEYMGKYYPEWDNMPWEEYKKKTKEFYKIVDDFYLKCKWHPMREKKTTILEVLRNDEPFIWIEDGVTNEELNDLHNTKNAEYYYINLDKNENQLLDVIEYIKDKL